MDRFTEHLRETDFSPLFESLGNLAKLPHGWLQKLERNSNRAMGPHSPITPITRSHPYGSLKLGISKAMNTKGTIGVYIEYDGQPMALVVNYFGGDDSWSGFTVDASEFTQLVRKQHSWSGKYDKRAGKYIPASYHEYHTNSMKITDLAEKVSQAIWAHHQLVYPEVDKRPDFSKILIDVYAIGADPQRIETRKERQEIRKGENTDLSVIKQKAQAKFAVNRIGSAIESRKAALVAILDQINHEIDQSLVQAVERIANGEEVKDIAPRDLDRHFTNLRKEIDNLSRLVGRVKSLSKSSGSSIKDKDYGSGHLKMGYSLKYFIDELDELTKG